MTWCKLERTFKRDKIDLPDYFNGFMIYKNSVHYIVLNSNHDRTKQKATLNRIVANFRKTYAPLFLDIDSPETQMLSNGQEDEDKLWK